MTFDLPENRKQILNRLQVYAQNEINDISSFLEAQLLTAILVANAGEFFSYYKLLEYLINTQIFPDTATGEYQDRWASIVNISRTQGALSSGNVVALGTANTSVPAGTNMTFNGKTYITQEAKTIKAQSLSIISITRLGTLATATTSFAHNFYPGQTVTISGANQSDYNGSFSITPTSTDKFTFTVANSPITPATGTILVTATFGSIPVLASEIGPDSDQTAGTKLTLDLEISGVEDDLYVAYGGLSGGASIEADPEYSARILKAFREPISHFSKAFIEAEVLKLANVTRVFVFPTTPGIGQVSVYFVNDLNSLSIIPSSSQVTQVKDLLVSLSPANMSSDDIIVSAPVPVPITISINNLSPDTQELRQAIEDNINVYFRSETEVGKNVTVDAIKSIILRTVDPSTGKLSDGTFTLTSPTVTTVIGEGQIATLNSIIFTSS